MAQLICCYYEKVKSISTEKQSGSAHIIIIAIVVGLILAAVGYLFWNNIVNRNVPTSTPQTSKTPVVENKPCNDGDPTAKNGIFCSVEIGITFKVPGIFNGKLTKIDNYDVFKGPLDYKLKENAGKSEVVYEAKLTGTDNYTFSIAQEPLRTGYTDFSHALQNTYYDQNTGQLTLVNTPTYHYDSATGITTESGGFAKSEAVPSFSVGNLVIFKGQLGDDGLIQNGYFTVIHNKIIKIILKNNDYMGDPANDPSTIDADKVFNELDASIKALKIL